MNFKASESYRLTDRQPDTASEIIFHADSRVVKKSCVQTPLSSGAHSEVTKQSS